MDCCIKINEFEGPLDLLLHLVKESNIDIYDININEITEQYMTYIHKMEQLNIDIASTYLVMAATLMEIKSKSLLPDKRAKEEGIEEEEEVSREALIQRLIEYQKYKEITKDFKSLEKERKSIYTKAPSKLNEMLEQKFENDSNITIEDLMTAFTKFLERKNMEKPIHTRVTSKEYSVKKRKKDSKFEFIIYGTLIGGILGNLIDRIRFGYLIDYLDFNFGSYSFPVFNLADTFIVISGIILMIKIMMEE